MLPFLFSLLKNIDSPDMTIAEINAITMMLALHPLGRIKIAMEFTVYVPGFSFDRYQIPKDVDSKGNMIKKSNEMSLET